MNASKNILALSLFAAAGSLLGACASNPPSPATPRADAPPPHSQAATLPPPPPSSPTAAATAPAAPPAPATPPVPPPPPPPPPPAAPAADRLPDPPPVQQATRDRTENFDQFLDAYWRDGRPRLAIYTAVLNNGSPASAAGNAAGDVARFNPRLESLFRAQEITLINADAMALATKQQVDAMSRNDEHAAAKMLADSLKADVVLLVRMFEQPPRADGVAYIGNYTLADLRRGTTIGSWSFDMFGDAARKEFTTVQMGEYAFAIARRSMNDFITHIPGTGALAGGRMYTIRVIGDYEDDDLDVFRNALGAIPGVKAGTVSLRAEDKGRSQSMSTFELFFAGDLLDLRKATRKAAVDRMSMEAQVIDSREGTIDIRLAPLSLSERERALTGGPETPRNIAARQQLRDAYEKAGRPTIAVMINKAAVEAEEPLATDAPPNNNPAMTAGGTAIVIGDRVNIGNGATNNAFAEKVIDRELRDRRAERKEDAVIDTRAFEDHILQRLLQLGLTPKDLSSAQADAFKDAAFDAKKQDDRSLSYSLGKKAGADVVLSGVGRLVRSRSDSTPLRIVFTMRAYKIADGAILGASTVQRDITGEESINQAVEELSAEAVGKIAATMMDTWKK